MSKNAMTLRSLTLLVATTALAGCNLAPKNVRPEGRSPRPCRRAGRIRCWGPNRSM
ncbi:hypothetical protein ACVOMT_02770 [Sphingomonas panni]